MLIRIAQTNNVLEGTMRAVAVSLLVSSLFVCTADAQVPVDFAGTWWNERCSKMDLTVTGDQLTGQYTSAVGKNAGQPYALTGYRAGVDLIAFAVNFGPTGSLAAWAGQHTVERGTEKIVTQWNLAVNVPDDKEDDQLWGAVWTGSDRFERSKPSQCP
jgi:hypothetical protein